MKGMSWPAVTVEQRDWVPTIDVPRRWQRTFTGPYRSALVPDIASADLSIPSDVAALTSQATASLAAFDAEMGDRVAPFASVLLRSESASSSRIEHLTASARAIALAELGDRSRRNAAEIAANSDAMRSAIVLADRLDAAAIVDMQHALLGRVDPAATGRWRQQPVWIGSSSYGPHTAEFVPPHHDRIAAAIDDLVRFMNRDDLPVLVQAALAHAQFETIHPFVDGNGRTGRALVHSLLRAKGVTRNITVPVSAGLLVNINEYFEALGAYRIGNPFPIIDRFAEAVFAAVQNGRALVEELATIRDLWAEALTVRADATVWRVLDVVLRQPVLDSQFIQRELGVTAPASDGAIALLTDAGALHQINEGRRNRKYEAPEILAALDAFAERGGRRGPPS